MNKKQLMKSIAFLLLFAALFVPVNRVLSRSCVDENYHRITDFYKEPEGSLDAVYIGSSNVFTFWNPLFGWEEFGITVYNYATDGLSFEATPYIMEEVLKTQPDTLFMVNLNPVRKGSDLGMTHLLVDHMPMSFTRISMIEALCDYNGWDSETRMALHFPLLQFHSRWSELNMQDFITDSNGLKVGQTHGAYFNVIEDVSSAYPTSREQKEPDEETMTRLERLLTYCDENQLKVLFLTVPQAKDSEEVVRELNYVEAYVRERGYPVLSMLNEYDALGLELSTDFYNRAHTNIHGSAKFVHYVGRYLVDNYGFRDKRGDAAYASWADARSRYDVYARPHILDIELSGEHWDYSLRYPENAAAVLSDGTVNLTWEPSDGAEGYRIYRRLGLGAWEQIGEVAGTSFADPYTESAEAPQYRIVPYRFDHSGSPLFGKFLPQGISVITK